MSGMSKVRDICKENNIRILTYSDRFEEYYITLEYIEDLDFFKHLYNLREEYIFNFELREGKIYLTVSGNEKLFNKIVESQENEIKSHQDIAEIIKFLNVLEEDNTEIVIYYDGINYIYRFNDNKYRDALIYYNFSKDNNSYIYKTINNEVVKEKFKQLNKDILLYKKLTKEQDKLLDIELTNKNEILDNIKYIYNKKGKKDLSIIFEQDKQYIVLKIGNNTYKYQYNYKLKILNMIPDLLEMYITKYKNNMKSETTNFFGKSFYNNSYGDDYNLNIYNIEEEELNNYLDYFRDLVTKKEKENLYNNNYIRMIKEEVSNNNGNVSILFLCISMLLIGVLSFTIMLLILK